MARNNAERNNIADSKIGNGEYVSIPRDMYKQLLTDRARLLQLLDEKVNYIERIVKMDVTIKELRKQIRTGTEKLSGM